MDKYIEMLSAVGGGYLHIAKAFATDNGCPMIEPAHLLRALLHKDMGLMQYIENTLDSDYYYLLDWADVRVGQAPKSPYPMREATLSPESRSVVKEARRYARMRGEEAISPKDLLAAVVAPGVGFSAEQLKTMPLTPDMIAGSDGAAKGAAVDCHPVQRGEGDVGSVYCTPLCGDGPEHEIVGFENVLRSLVETLARRDKANVLIVGETGVGKSSLVAAFARRVAEGVVPTSLKGLYPVELDLVSLSQGVTYKGEVEDRFKSVTDEVCRHPQPLLVIEDFHRVMDRQAPLNGILPVLKRLLAKGQIQVVLTSTVDEFTKNIEKDKELLSYCEKITVEEPEESLANDILASKAPAYSAFHGVALGDNVLEETVRLSKRYMTEKCLPSSAIDLLDRAMASLKIMAEESAGHDAAPVLEKEFVRDVVASMTGLPVGNLQSEEREKLSGGQEMLKRRVVGQDHAVKSVLDAVCESRSGLAKKGQPIGSFFFLGPTGTGKTELAKALAEFMFGDSSAMLRFDMSEYKEEHSVALLYGAPPGYVGYEEGGLLVNQIRRHPYSVVLFDEIEKAHRSVFDLFLQILDEGKLHDRLGRVGDFSNALIIFTSNIGSEHIFRSFEQGHVPGHEEMLEVMQGHFRPEFLARLTEILPFSPVTPEMISKIFDINIRSLVGSLESRDIRLVIDQSARSYITKTGFNTHYGARPVLGIIRKEIRRPLSKMIIAGDIEDGDTVVMKHDADKNEIIWEIDTPEHDDNNKDKI